jgi:hypothetical protein
MCAQRSYLFTASNGRNNENTVPLRPYSSLVRKRNIPRCRRTISLLTQSPEASSIDALRRVERLEYASRDRS